MKLLVFLLVCFLLLGCNKPTEYDQFIQEISKYPSFNKDYSTEYFEEFKKTDSYVIALNKVNHPNFYTTSTDQIWFDKLLLINKYHGVSEEFVPSNLVKVENVEYIQRVGETMYIDKNVLLNYQSMVDDAKSQNIHLVLFSAYRTYNKQLSLWNKIPTFDDMYLAVPGFSEHHSGLALDISTKEDGLTKNKSKAYNYLKDNAHKFGFILRYPKGKESITGYSYEPWHFRYVGEIASEIYNQDLTLEEYIYKFIAI